MANIKIDPNSFVPHGEMIRELLSQTYISEADLRAVSRKRGVFFRDHDKMKTIPFMACTLLSPCEFQLLVERQSVKEDNLKSAGSGQITVTPEFKDMSDFLFNEIKPKLNALISRDEALRNNYKVLDIPRITVVSNNEIDVDFSIERSNLTKSWVNHKSTFTGTVNFKKVNNQITASRFYTSEETKTIVNKIASLFEKTCKEKKYVKEDQQEKRIRFDDFNNETRIQFLLKLFNSNETRALDLEGKDIIDFEFCGETSITLPEDLAWMDNKEKLIFKGKKIETTFFLEQSAYYPNLVVWRMSANYGFKLIGRGVEGKAKIDFYFNEYAKDRAMKAPLEINFGSPIEINKPSNLSYSQKEQVKKELLIRLEDLKNVIYEKYFTS